MFSQTDIIHMKHALALATRGFYTTDPNPRVGCVFVKNGEVIGDGFTQPVGQDHAEICALKDVRKRGNDPRDATVYVTLEPCSHFGHTPPCVNALIDAGVIRIIAAMEDPNPLVSGRGFTMLRYAGIDVHCGLLANEARELNIGFVSRLARGYPWVRMKIAASLDGRIGLPSGESQWITGKAARADGHAWRARASAILTGIGTVKADNPCMMVRAIDTLRQPMRVLVDSKLEVPLEAKILVGAPTLIFCSTLNQHNVERINALRARGAEIVSLTNKKGKVDLPAMLKKLGERGVNELQVEAGYRLSGALLREGCVDELLIYLAPTLLGANSLSMLNLSAPDTLAQCLQLNFHSVERIGMDLRILARFPFVHPLD